MSSDSENTINNKRIAKNTALLYVRMLFLMAVGLFTSRVILASLGVVDYGISNVVGGVVAMFGFLNAAMTTSTQRYLTYELGRGETGRLRLTFMTSVYIHIIIAATGNKKINDKLSRKRAEAVYECLTKEFGVPESLLEIDHKGGVENMFYDDPALSRAAITKAL